MRITHTIARILTFFIDVFCYTCSHCDHGDCTYRMCEPHDCVVQPYPSSCGIVLLEPVTRLVCHHRMIQDLLYAKIYPSLVLLVMAAAAWGALTGFVTNKRALDRVHYLEKEVERLTEGDWCLTRRHKRLLACTHFSLTFVWFSNLTDRFLRAHRF